jgi:hypothetical protein
MNNQIPEIKRDGSQEKQVRQSEIEFLHELPLLSEVI